MMTLLFGADKIQLTQLEALSEATPDLLTTALPVLALLLVLEMIINFIHQKKTYELKETLGTLMVGAGNALINIGSKLFLLTILVYVYNQAPWRQVFSIWTIIPCYLLYDFISYWVHRLCHHQRFWWATHVVHHSSENFNMTVSFRLSWLEYLKFIFILPLSLLGFHPVILLIVSQLSSLYQFWVHTEYIPKLHPVVEYIFVTPSNHRVHHASQTEYLNKNFGGTFIIWDRLFGTYKDEQAAPVFGLTENQTEKINPLHINFHEYASIYRDVKKAKGFRNKMFYLFGDPMIVKQRCSSGENQPPGVD